MGEGINIPTALGPFSSRHTTSAQGSRERRRGVCNIRERSFVLKEPCVQSALPSLESCQKSCGIKDKRQRRPSKAQHNWSCCGRAPVLSTTQTLGCLSPQGLKDYTGQLWGSVTVTETSPGCQLSPPCPCCDTPSAQQRPPPPLTSALELK